jgi:Zn-dependent M28 family amino/carboxypeptidase
VNSDPRERPSEPSNTKRASTEQIAQAIACYHPAMRRWSAPLLSLSLASVGVTVGLGGCGDDAAAPGQEGGSGSASDDQGSGESGEPSSGTDAGTDSSDSADTETDTDTLVEPICASPLSESISAEAIAAHLLAFDGIATANGGNRAAGTPGYEASAAYVEASLAAAGYTTTRWPFSFDRYVQFGPPLLATDGPNATEYLPGQHYAVGSYSPAGEVEAELEAVDLQLGVDNQSSSGCEPEDFAGFTPGRIALVQRGSCTFATKASNAEAAGAVATIIFNQGNNDANLGLFAGTLGSQSQLDAPVLFTTYAVGVALADVAALESVQASVRVDAGVESTETFNVLAETPTGDPERVIMLGAHLDSVPAGPGVNDNGSGSATVLELARQFAGCSPKVKVRFAWWGAEEWGLHGSRQWVAALSDDELAGLAFYLNFDMLASPNYVRYVHHGGDGPEGSTLLFDSFSEWFSAAGLAISGASFSGNSDYAPFVEAGVPSSGLATGAGGSKSASQAETFGGTAGQAYDACYHQACDDQDNFALDALGHNGQAAAHVLERWATDLGPLAATPDLVSAHLDLAGPAVHECGHLSE